MNKVFCMSHKTIMSLLNAASDSSGAFEEFKAKPIGKLGRNMGLLGNLEQ